MALGNTTIYNGTAGNDVFQKIGFGDLIAHGNDGDDRIDGSSGNDSIFGDAGNDRVFGQEGNDFVSGGSGDDFVNGGFGNDRVYGDSGNDTVTGLGGTDFVSGGDGDDLIVYMSAQNAAWGSNPFHQGNDTLVGGAGADDFDLSAFTDAQVDLIDNGDGTYTAEIYTGAEVLIDGGAGLDQIILADAIIDIG